MSEWEYELLDDGVPIDDPILGQAVHPAIPGLQFDPFLAASPGIPGGLSACSSVDQNDDADELAYAGNVAAAMDIPTDGRDSECSPPGSVTNGASSASVADAEEERLREIKRQRVRNTRAKKNSNKAGVQQDLQHTADKIDDLNRQLQAIELENENLRRQNAELEQANQENTQECRDLAETEKQKKAELLQLQKK